MQVKLNDPLIDIQISVLESLALYNLLNRAMPQTDFEAVFLLNLTGKLRVELNSITKKY